MLIEIFRHAGHRTATPIEPSAVPGARSQNIEGKTGRGRSSG